MKATFKKVRYQGTTVEIKAPVNTIHMDIMVEIAGKTRSENIATAIADLFCSLRNVNGYILVEHKAYTIDNYGNCTHACLKNA